MSSCQKQTLQTGQNCDLLAVADARYAINGFSLGISPIIFSKGLLNWGVYPAGVIPSMLA